MVNNYNESNFFDRLVIKHYKLKDKRHLSGDKRYSDYDVLVGIQIFSFIGLWIFMSLGTALLILVPLLSCWLLNNMDFTLKEQVEENVKQ